MYVYIHIYIYIYIYNIKFPISLYLKLISVTQTVSINFQTDFQTLIVTLDPPVLEIIDTTLLKFDIFRLHSNLLSVIKNF